MTVTDPDVPDPLNDPRTLQADPGANGQGDDLASAADDPASTGEDELTTGRTPADDAGGADVTGGLVEGESDEDVVGGPLTGGGTTAGGVS
ncbi:hypothetical protein [Blastococcus sp. URHD0036]|uniref:hypothetical protein n=1 Tax=Blastococcus sp. URHD0036 TaxID=1380356 RepID=UPI001E285983|nr:hypothetical protein [Blastococcus sp. URHD0036]